LSLKVLGHYLKVANNVVVNCMPQTEGEKVVKAARKSTIKILWATGKRNCNLLCY